MGADSSAENTPNAPEFICPICLSKPKSSGFQEKKALLGVRSPCSPEMSDDGAKKCKPPLASLYTTPFQQAQ